MQKIVPSLSVDDIEYAKDLVELDHKFLTKLKKLMLGEAITQLMELSLI